MPRLRYTGKVYHYAKGRLFKGEIAEFSEEDAARLLNKSRAGLWSPVDEGAEVLVTERVPDTPLESPQDALDEVQSDEEVSEVAGPIKCAYIKPDGSQCKGYATTGSEFCFFHKQSQEGKDPFTLAREKGSEEEIVEEQDEDDLHIQ